MAKPHGLKAEMNPAERARLASVVRLTVFTARLSGRRRSYAQVLGDERSQVLCPQA